MPPLIEHRLWLDRTALTGRPRSAELKALDKALLAYEVRQRGGRATTLDFQAVAGCFDAWRRKTGGGTARDRHGAVRTLELQLARLPTSAWQNGLIDSRRGLIFLFANMRVDGGVVKLAADGLASTAAAVIKLDAVAQGIGGSSLVDRGGRAVLGRAVKSVPGQVAGGLVNAHQDGISAAWNKFINDAKAFLLEIVEAIKRLVRRQESELQIDSWLSSAEKINDVIKLVLGMVAREAAPFVSAGLDIGMGLAKTGVAVGRRLQAHFASVGVVLAVGHPGVVVAQIQNAMNLAIGKGLYTAIKGAIMLSSEIVTAGGSKLAGVLVAAAEALVRLVWRLVERARMKAFFTKCKVLWTSMSDNDADYSRHPFLSDGLGFGRWYAKASVAMPCLSALALTSGFTGDKMRYLQMFEDAHETRRIDRDAFKGGVAFLDLMKVNAARYLRDSGFKFALHNGEGRHENLF